jgi:type II secretory pathway pseudopilin PulG
MRRDAGFTFVELGVALLLAAVVAGAAGVIYLANARSFRDGREKAILQQNLTWCVEAISRDARAASRAQVPSAQRMILYGVDGSVLATWDLVSANGASHLRRNGKVMAPEACTALVFSIANPDTSTVGVTLEFMDPEADRIQMTSRITLRNRYASAS